MPKRTQDTNAIKTCKISAQFYFDESQAVVGKRTYNVEVKLAREDGCIYGVGCKLHGAATPTPFTSNLAWESERFEVRNSVCYPMNSGGGKGAPIQVCCLAGLEELIQLPARTCEDMCIEVAMKLVAVLVVAVPWQ